MDTASIFSKYIGDELIIFRLNRNFDVFLSINGVLLLTIVVVAAIVLLVWLRGTGIGFGRFGDFEIDEAQLGIGEQKFKLRPNATDRQIAYKIWVELSTRKIGLLIDLEDDLISETYDSWYKFFAVTRELIKDVPISKVRRKDTQKIIRLSIDVLNTGLRPHLTRWQARFRRWYEQAIESQRDSAPQVIQKSFPEYSALADDLLRVNRSLIQYRKKMYQLVSGSESEPLL